MKKTRPDVERNFRSILLPVVYAWLIAAICLVGVGLYYPDRILPEIESYIALLTITGSPALLAISEINRLYAQHQESKIALTPEIEKHEMNLASDRLKHHNKMDAEERLAKIRMDENE